MAKWLFCGLANYRLSGAVMDGTQNKKDFIFKAPFGSISNMTNPVGICSYCKIDPQAPSATLVAHC